MRQQNNKRNSLVKKTVKELRPKTLNSRSGSRPSGRKTNFKNESKNESYFGSDFDRTNFKPQNTKFRVAEGSRPSFQKSEGSRAGFEKDNFSGFQKKTYNGRNSKSSSFKSSYSDYKSDYKPSYKSGYKSDHKSDYREDYFSKTPKENKDKIKKTSEEYDTSGYMDQKDYPERKPGGYLGQYQLLDCGDGKKLEAFGRILIIRPCPQALWPKSELGKTAEIEGLGEKSISDLWNLADFEFVRTGQEKGFWWHRKSENLESRKASFEQNRYPFNENLPGFWTVSCGGISWRIEPNQFGNIGIFSEHFEYVGSLLNFFDKNEKVLNLFTYSGSNCVLLAKNNFKITAVDSSKSAISAFSENLQNNSVPKENCRLILEDAYKFVAREVRREAKYGSIMIDAPSYGRGTKGEIFNIEESLKELIQSCQELMDSSSKMVITLHSPRFTPKMLEIFIKSLFVGKNVKVEEIVQNCVSGNQLTSGMLVCVE